MIYVANVLKEDDEDKLDDEGIDGDKSRLSEVLNDHWKETIGGSESISQTSSISAFLATSCCLEVLNLHLGVSVRQESELCKLQEID